MIRIVALFLFSFSIVAAPEIEKQPHIIEGLHAFERGDIEKSEKIFSKLLKEYPRNNTFLYNMGNIKLVQKEYKLAAHYYKIVISQKSELTPAAKIYLSQALDAQGNYRDAVRLLGEALDTKLSDSLYNLAMDEVELYQEYEEEFLKQANHQFDQRDYKRALENYRLAWVINPNDQNNFKLGHTLLLLGKLKEAEVYFYRIKDDKIFKSAEDLMYEYGILKAIQITEEKRFSLYLDYSSGSNSNPNTQSEGDVYNSDTESVLAYGGSYSYLIWKKITANIGLDGYIDSFSSDPESKTTAIALSLPFIYKKKNYDLSFTPKRENTNYGGSPYVRNTSYDLNHIYYFKSAKSSVSYNYTNYAARDSDYDYLSGNGQSFDLSYTYMFSGADLTLGYQWGRERLNDSDSSISSNDNRTIELAVFVPIADRVSFDVSTSYQISEFLADSSDFAQKDATWTSYVTLTVAIKDYFSIYARERFIKNNSNVAGDSLDYNYTQQYFALGGTFYLNF